MTITKFEEIKAWQEARKFANNIYQITNSNKFKKDIRLLNQIQSSAVSIMANIAEGFERQTNKEFINFLFIARGSLAETVSHLYVGLDQKYIMESDFNESYENGIKIKGLINGFISYLKKSSNFKA